MEELDFTPVEDEATIPESEPAEKPTGTAAEEAAAETTEAEPQEPAGETAADDTAREAEDVPFITVTYNKQPKGLTQEEAVRLAQIGLKAEPELHKLDYLAAQSGISVSQLVDGIMQAADDKYRRELKDEFGDDSERIEELLELRKNKQQKKYERVLADRKAAETAEAEKEEKALSEKIAAELTEVTALFPEIKEFKDLPESVRKAACSGKDVLKEILKFKFNEQKNVEKEKATAALAAGSSAGSVKTPEPAEEASEVSAFSKGVWG